MANFRVTLRLMGSLSFCIMYDVVDVRCMRSMMVMKSTHRVGDSREPNPRTCEFGARAHSAGTTTDPPTKRNAKLTHQHPKVAIECSHGHYKYQ